MKNAESRGNRARHRRVVTPRERLTSVLRRRPPARPGPLVVDGSPRSGGPRWLAWTSAVRRFRPSLGGLLRVDRPRPRVVTVACALMVVLMLLQLANAVLSLTVGVEVGDAIERDVGAEGQGDVNAAIGIVFGLTVAVLLPVLAVLNMRGSNAGRVATWVLAALWLFVGFCLLARTALFPAVGEIGRFKTYSITAAGLSVVLYVTIMVLLARPEANAFFRPVVPDSEYDPGTALPRSESFFRPERSALDPAAPGWPDVSETDGRAPERMSRLSAIRRKGKNDEPGIPPDQ